MAKIVKAKILTGHLQGEIVRISNVSTDELGRKKAACMRMNGQRMNLPLNELELIEEVIEEKPQPRGISMPFISGSTSSRSMTHTKNMNKIRPEQKTTIASNKENLTLCENCGEEYNLEARKEMAGKITHCEHCAEETENKMVGKMIFSHKTGATIEIKKDGELKHEADSFDYKNKT